MTKINIVVDTNIFYPDPLLQGRVSSILRGAWIAADAKVWVPQVVVHELVEQYERKCDEAARGVLRGGSALEALGVDSVVDADELWAVCAASVGTYENRLLERIRGIGASVARYPEVSHEILARRVSRKTRPFADGGRGYNDTLIWFTALELAERVEGDVLLLTRNLKDFSLGKKRVDLHSDLVDDLRARGVETSRVRLLDGLQKLYEELVEPAETELADLRERFNSETGGDELRSEVLSVVHAHLEANPAELDFGGARGAPAEFEMAEIAYMEAVDLEVTWAERVDGRAVLYGSAWVHGVVEISTTVYDPEYGPSGSETGSQSFSSEVNFSVRNPFGDEAEVSVDEVASLTVGL